MMLLFSLARDRYSTQALKNPPKPQTSVFRWSSCALRLHSVTQRLNIWRTFIVFHAAWRFSGAPRAADPPKTQVSSTVPSCIFCTPLFSLFCYNVQCFIYIYIIITRLYISYCESLPSLFLLNEDDLISLCSRPTDGIMLVFLCVLNGWFYK